MWKYLVIVAFVFGIYFKFKTKIFPNSAPRIDLVDTDGRKFAMGPATKRPVLVGFWIDQCGYSDRILKIMNHIKEKYPDSIDVAGFYLNAVDNESLKTMKDSKKLNMRIFAGQKTVDIYSALVNSFEIRGAGTDIYLIDNKGKIHNLDALSKSETSADIERKLLKLIRKKTALGQGKA